MSNELLLSVHEENGIFYVKDQDGRVLKGVREITVNAAINNVTNFTINVIDQRDDRPARTNKHYS